MASTLPNELRKEPLPVELSVKFAQLFGERTYQHCKAQPGNWTLPQRIDLDAIQVHKFLCNCHNY